jgi:hypothetical protein
MVSRRMMIAGGAGALVAAGLGYRIWDRGVFEGPHGAPYAPWDDWQGSIADGMSRPLSAAILAANPHDTQPWLFELGDGRITVYADRARNLGSFDPFRREMQLGIGCAIENFVRAAGVYGLVAYVIPVAGTLTNTPPNLPKVVAHIALDAAPAGRDLLYEAIPYRHTNRGAYLDRPVAPDLLRNLEALTNDADVRVVFLSEAPRCHDLAALIVKATERIVADPQMSADSARWIRTGRRDIEKHRDGVTVDVAGLSTTTAAFAKLLPDLSAAQQDQYWLSNTRDVQTRAPVLGAIFVRDRFDMAATLAAGRAWQRLHLAATHLGLSAQPLNQPVECIDRNLQVGRPDNYCAELQRLAGVSDGQPTFIFRLGYAERPAPPSPRRPLEDVILRSGFA